MYHFFYFLSMGNKNILANICIAFYNAPMQLKQYRKETAAKLMHALSDKLDDYHYHSALLDTDILLEYVIHKNRSWILAHGEIFLSSDEKAELDKLVNLRLTGKPIAYITRKKEFFSFGFFVDERVLIPKSDTEILVEHALDFCAAAISQTRDTFTLLDVCCGSGCIGIALLKSLAQLRLQRMPKLELTLLDISAAALDVARINASALLRDETASNAVDVRFIRADLTDGFPEKFDCIVSNPPYVPTDTAAALLKDGRSEPLLALDGGHDGLALYPHLAAGIKNALTENGAFFVEAGEYNIEVACNIFEKSGLKELRIHPDLNNQKRIIAGRI